MNIKAINVELQTTRGKPLFYSINPLTVGADHFAILAGLACGYVECFRIRERWARVKARIARQNANN